jgi:hypothetical protein
MYPEIQAKIDRIAQEAFQIWRVGESAEPLIAKRLQEANMTEWVSDVRRKLSQVIHSNYLNSKL